MSIRSNFKIHKGIIFSLALIFIFRLLFINICLLTSLKTSQINKFTASHVAGMLAKRASDTEVAVNSRFEAYSAVEVCEERSDNEESLMKAASAILFAFVFLLFKRVVSSSESAYIADSINYRLYSKRYLSLSTLRI